MERRLCEDRGPDWRPRWERCSYKPKKAKGCWRTTRNQEEYGKDPFYRLQRENGPAAPLVLDSRPPDCERIHFVVWGHPVVVLCPESPRKLIPM